MGQVLPWNLGSSILRGAILQSTVMARFSLSTAPPPGLSSARAARIAIREITPIIIHCFFIRVSKFAVRLGPILALAVRETKTSTPHAIDDRSLITHHSLLFTHLS